MGSDDGGVDHGVFIVGVLRQRLKNLPPRPVAAPACMPRVNGTEVSKPLRQVAPRDPGAVAV